MGKKVSRSAVHSLLRDKTVISRLVEKSLVQELEISCLGHHVSVFSHWLHEANKKITVVSDVVVVYCLVCGRCHDSTSCKYWNGSRPGVGVNFGEVVDVAPLEEEVAEVMVMLLVMASSVASSEVAENVAMELAEEVAVVEESEVEKEGQDAKVGLGI